MKNWVLAILFLSLIIGCTPLRKYPVSDHYSAEKDLFYNPTTKADKGFLSFLKWKLFTSKAEWPKWIDISPAPNTQSPRRANESNITFINHSTFLIQTSDYNILTDPVWSERVSPVSFAGPKRVHKPGLEIDKLPKIDIVVISHNHYDHLDIETLKKLEELYSPSYFVPLGDASLLKEHGLIKVFELDWWEEASFNNFKITLVPTQHWSARGVFDRYHSLWGGYVLAWDKHKIFFGGDTGYSSHFKAIYQKYGAMDLSLLPIGAYAPRWFMQTMHMDPEEALWAHQDLKSKFSIGIHFGTFQLTNEGIDEPLTKLKQHKLKLGIPDESFSILKPGHSKVFSF